MKITQKLLRTIKRHDNLMRQILWLSDCTSWMAVELKYMHYQRQKAKRDNPYWYNLLRKPEYNEPT